jgi:hypothetical protein
MSQRGKSEWNQFVQMYYPKVAHLAQTERFGALAALRDRMAAAGQWQKQYSPSYAGGRHANPRHCNRLPAKKCKSDEHCSWIKRSPSHRAYCRRQGGFLAKRRSRFAGTQRIPAVYMAAAAKVLAPQIAAAVAGVPDAPPMVAESPLATLLNPGIPDAPPLVTDKEIVAAAVDDAQAGFCSRFSQGDCQKHFRCSWDDAARICRLADKAKQLVADDPAVVRARAFAAQARDDEYRQQAQGILGVNPLNARKERPDDFMEYLGDMSPKAISPRKQGPGLASVMGGRKGVCKPLKNQRDCDRNFNCHWINLGGGNGSCAKRKTPRALKQYERTKANDEAALYLDEQFRQDRARRREALELPPPLSPSKGKRVRRVPQVDDFAGFDQMFQ